MKKRTKGILIGGAILLAAAAVITGAVVGSVVTSKQKRENARNNNNNSNQDQNTEKPVFEPNISLLKASYDSLNFRIDNLKSKDFSGKNIKVKLVNTLVGSNQSFEKTYSISKDDVELLFDNLTDGSKYKVSVVFEDKEIIAKEFETLLRPKISELSKTSTNAVLNLSDLNKLSKEELDKIEIVIQNKTNSSKPNIVIKASELEIVGGLSRVDLEKVSANLEPGQTYNITVEMKKTDGSNEILSSPIELTTPQPSNVAYNYNAKNKPKEVAFYGLKTNDKKIIFKYKPYGTNIEYTSITSQQNVSNGQVIVNITQDLGFDNQYEFRIKYEGEDQYLTFENNTDKGIFRTEPAPVIVADFETGSGIKLDKLSENINKDNLYVRYRDKDNSNTWIETPIKNIPGFEENNLSLENLAPDTNYEIQLVYKKDNSENSKVILSQTEFATKKDFVLEATKSFASFSSVLLTFKDNNKAKVNDSNEYLGLTLKYVKVGESEINQVNLSKKVINDMIFAQALPTNLEKNTLYNWTLEYNNSKVLSGSFKTGSNSSDTNEESGVNDVLVENNLSEGIKVSVKNNFGYIYNSEAELYYPRNISIKYYKNDEPNNFQTEIIKVSRSDLDNAKMFTHLFNDLENGLWKFEVSYDYSLDTNNNLKTFKQTFEINYKSPEISFNNENSTLSVNNLEFLNGKNLIVRYNEVDSTSISSNEGIVTEGVLNVQLDNLKSNTQYIVNVEISSEDVEFYSSISNRKRNEFYVDSANNKLILNSEFQTFDRGTTILTKEEKYFVFEDKVDSKFSLEGFKDYAGKTAEIKILNEDGSELASPSNSADNSLFVYNPEDELVKSNQDNNIVVHAYHRENQNNEEAVKVIDGDKTNKWNDWTGNQQAFAEDGWFSIHFPENKDISAIGLYLMNDNNTGSKGPLSIVVEYSENYETSSNSEGVNTATWIPVSNQSKTTDFRAANGNFENIITFNKINTKNLRIKFKNRPSSDNHFFVFGLNEMKVYGSKNKVSLFSNKFEGVINEEGVFESNNWIYGLEKNKKYKVVASIKEQTPTESTEASSSSEPTITKVVEKVYKTPNFDENFTIQSLKAVDSNTQDPKLKIENLDLIKLIFSRGYGLKLRAQRVNENTTYKTFDNLKNKSTFTGDLNTFNLTSLDLNWDLISNSTDESGNISLKKLAKYEETFKNLFANKEKYQVILTLEKDSEIYVLASTDENKYVVVNFNPPVLLNNQETSGLKKNSETNKFETEINYSLGSIEGYNSGDNPLKVYFIEENNVLSSSNPTNWELKGNVTIDSTNNNNGSIKVSGLKPDTVYKMAIVDKDGNIIISKDRVKTLSTPKLRNTTFGDTLMRFTLSNLKGSQEVIQPGKYVIKYSEDLSYGLSSNEVMIEDVTNFEGTYSFTLENLKPNTTYNYKFVKVVDDNEEVVLGYQDLFRTNKSQFEETVIANDYAVVKLINPSYKLREKSYSIAVKDPENENKMILDVLKLEYSTTENFTPETTKEFSVSLSESEASLLPIKIENLESNTKYYYRLLKGTIKSNVIKNSRTTEDNSAPEVTFESNPIISGSLTTSELSNTITTTNNSAKLEFKKPTNFKDGDELLLRYKRDDSSKEYLVEYNYDVRDDKITFNVDNLNNNTYYEYLLLDNKYNEYASGKFATKTNNELAVKLINVGEIVRRVELKNADNYLNQKVRISHKKQGDANYTSIDVVITPENNKFLWDIVGLEELKNYDYKIELLDNSNEVSHLLQQGIFDVERAYLAADQKVTTNVRTYGNYDLNKWYTITNLQEIYANNLNWKQKVKESLQEVAIFGTEVSNDKYAWHTLIHDSNRKQYAEETNEGLVYSYLFNDNGKLKGVKFELRLFGNLIQVKVIEAKAKKEPVEPVLLVDQFNYSDLNEDLLYKASGGAINEKVPSILGNKFINISGFKFKAQRSRINSKDYSVPQIFRYSLEEASPALNELTPSINNNSVGAFINLNNPKQKDKYGTFNDGVHNYNVIYNAYVSKNNKLLPFNGNFLISNSAYPGLGQNGNAISVPGFNGNDKELRNKFFKALFTNGMIRFTGSDTRNKNWISFDSPDILLIDDDMYAYSEKYQTEMPVKRLIWKDGNEIKGIRITLSDAKYGNGAVLGQFDDFVYFKEINENVNLNNITWDSFVENAKKLTIHNYMNPDSPGTSIGGISFTSKDKMFIDNSYRTYNNFSSDNLAPKFLYEVNVESETSTTRIVKMSNYDVGTYKIKVQYLTYFGKLTPEQIFNEQDVVITEENKSLVTINLTQKLIHNGKYKISLLNSQNQEINSATGDNYQSTDGVFIIPDVSNLNAGAHPGDRYGSTSGWLGYYLDRLFGFESSQYSSWYEKTKETLKYGLIGSTKFNDGTEISRKWGKAVFNKDLPEYPRHPLFLFAALSDDNTKVIITELLLEPTNGNANNIISVYSGAKLFTLEENDPKTLDDMTDEWIRTKFESGRNATNLEKVRVLSSSSHENRTALLGLYFENPRPKETVVENAQPNSTGSEAGSQ